MSVIEEKEYQITVTLTFSTTVRFAAIERDGSITTEDAIANFYGYGLGELIDSGEYEVGGYDSIKVVDTDNVGV